MKEDLVIVINETDASSRASAKKYFTVISSEWNKYTKIHIDCSLCKSVNLAFADEAFGCLAFTKTKDEILDKVTIISPNVDVVASFAKALFARVREIRNKG